MLFTTILIFLLLISKFQLNFALYFCGIKRFQIPAIILVLPYTGVEILKIIGGLRLTNLEIYRLGFNTTIFYEALSNIIQLVTILIFYKFIKLIKLPKLKNPSNDAKFWRRIEFHTIIIYFIVFITMTTASWNTIDWVANPRAGYQFHRGGFGLYWATMVTLIPIAQLTHLYTGRYNTYRTTFLYTILAYFTGSKDVIIGTVLLSLFIAYKLQKMNIANLLIISIFMAMLILVNFFLAYNSLAGLGEILNYFDYYHNGAMAHQGLLNGSIQLQWGEVILSNFQNELSRINIVEVPKLVGDQIFMQIFYPGSVEAGHFPAFGGKLLYTADFGPLGFLLYIFSLKSILIAFALVWIKKLQFKDNDIIKLPSSVFPILLLFSGNFGMFFPDFSLIPLLIIVYLFLKLGKFNFMFTHKNR